MVAPMADDAPGEVPSPCVRNCCLDEDNVCLGCSRSISEICGWSQATEAEKREILVRCRIRHEERHARLKARG
jgi:predicted Fe-S protein YdhL (DUF1289 family)